MCDDRPVAGCEALTGGYASYLVDSGAPQSLSPLLRQIGREVEASLLDQYLAQGDHWTTVGPDRCWAGRRPPTDPAAGARWFDPAELVVSVLVPRSGLNEIPEEWHDRLTPFTAWLATSPLAHWQVAAVAALVGDDVHAGAAMTGRQASRVANALGKSLSTSEDWSSAVAAFGVDVVREWWGRDETKLGGYVDEGLLELVTWEGIAAHSDLDDLDEVTVDEWDPVTFPFHTHVSTQVGLLDAAGTWAWPR